MGWRILLSSGPRIPDLRVLRDSATKIREHDLEMLQFVCEVGGRRLFSNSESEGPEETSNAARPPTARRPNPA